MLSRKSTLRRRSNLATTKARFQVGKALIAMSGSVSAANGAGASASASEMVVHSSDFG